MAIDFRLTEEQEAIRELAHNFAANEMRPNASYYDEHEETPWDIMRKAHELGIGPSGEFPTQYGGGGLDRVTALLLQEELSWGDAGIAVSIMASGLAGTGILAMGTEEQKKKYIGMLCDPKDMKLAALALTEPNSGSDSLSLETTATKVDGGYLLNGTKQFCTNGGIADIHVVFANRDRSLRNCACGAGICVGSGCGAAGITSAAVLHAFGCREATHGALHASHECPPRGQSCGSCALRCEDDGAAWRR